MGNLCGIKKLPNESIVMYGTKISDVLPMTATLILNFSKTHTSEVYSANKTDETGTEEWGTIRRHLIINVLKRTIGRQAKLTV